ncbi:hypothetical protein EV201_0371 [Ancylomarina subtilis]|uniref:Uncharacterized protein n=1 Tax=Ancylomarina subtilis TaxID=1639035 RepID=A0A4Q7VHZ9_9BACT|nr:hypothetical protein [Ancylomarina subtilis]RZT95746.1 hypothetical protein EV201_0371 [Ancylomarina subtilis]
MNQPNPSAAFLPLILIFLVIAIAVYKLAKEKGKNVALWTMLACIPIVNIISVIYIVGATNSRLEAKIDRLLKELDREE